MMDKQRVVDLIIERLQEDLATSEQAVKIARDTATHKDCLGSSKYETMGLEASYLAQGQGIRLLEIERALAYFKQLRLPELRDVVVVPSLLLLSDEQEKEQLLWLSADAGGMRIQYDNHPITLITAKSPLGKYLIGKSLGEPFEVNIAGKRRGYEVVQIF